MLAFQTCHARVKFEWLWADFLKDGDDDDLQFFEALGVDETAAEGSIEISPERNLHLSGVFAEEGKHVLVDDVESLPELSDGLQAFGSESDLISLDKLCDFNEGVANAFTFTDIADGLDDMVVDGFAVVNEMCHDGLELKSVVFLDLIQKKVFV